MAQLRYYQIVASRTTNRVIRIATRASALAMWQANHISSLLRAANPELTVELVEVSTQGDRDRATALSTMGGQGVFTREVQAAVLDGRADLAVHSLKDLPTEKTPNLMLGGVPARAPVCDALIMPLGFPISGKTGHELLLSLPQGATVGTGSLRRRAQLLHMRPDLNFVENRGNLDTRLRKLDEGQFAAIVLAEAGLTRLGLQARVSGILQPPHVLPAVGQGAIGIECRSDDYEVQNLLAGITDYDVLAAVTAERTVLSELRAGCHAPLGVMSSILPNGRIQLDAAVLSVDGRERVTTSASGVPSSALLIGLTVATTLRCLGAYRLLCK